MKIISAEEARKLAKIPEKRIQLELLEIDKRIKEASAREETSILMRGEIYDTYPDRKNWRYELQEIVQYLEKSGFKCEMFYEERQFVDLGLRIRWDI